MLHIKCCIAANLAFIALLPFAPALAQSDASTPFMSIVGGRVSAEVHEDRVESIKRNRTGDPVAGKVKSQLCQGCHGESGNSTDPGIPKLAGQFGNYIAKQIRNYQSGTRTNQIMSAMAATINDDDLADIAAYFSSQEKMQGNGLVDNPFGKTIFSNNGISDMGLACINCHGEGGRGLEPKISIFPVIGGQHKDYLRSQLINFRDGNRTNSPNNMMNRMTSSLTDADIEALASFISRQAEVNVEPSQTQADNRDKKHKPRSRSQ